MTLCVIPVILFWIRQGELCAQSVLQEPRCEEGAGVNFAINRGGDAHILRELILSTEYTGYTGEAFKFLLKYGAPLTVHTLGVYGPTTYMKSILEAGMTPLAWAVSQPNSATVQALVDAGANATVMGKISPLFAAVQSYGALQQY
jgi:hypothetical protein